MINLYRFILLLAISLIGILQSHALVLNVTTSEQKPTCLNATDGWVTIDGLVTVGASGPYIIRINTSPVTFFSVGDTVFNLTTINYVITVIDLADNSVAFQPVNYATSGINTGAFAFSTSCFGASDGTASIAVAGGTAPYTFAWSTIPVQTTQVAGGLPAGRYHVTVSDNNGCSAIDSADVPQPTKIQANVNVTQPLCFGDLNGSATAVPTGGTGTFNNFQWSSSANNTATEGGLGIGTYTVTVTDSDGCTNDSTFTVGQPAALSVSFAITPNLCFGGDDGVILTTPAGGTGAYTYNWIDGPTVRNRNNLTAATYTVTITDNNGCTLVDSAIVGEQPEIISTLTVTANNSCFGDLNGSINAVFSGGTGPLSFDWSQGTSGNGSPSAISNLAAGKYTITITDAFGCQKLDSATITEPNQIQITTDLQTDPTCNGGTDGAITISATGGTVALDYTYAWPAPGSQTTAAVTGLSAGNYIVTVTDDNACTATQLVTLNDPGAIVPVVTTIPSTCFGGSDGSATANPTGGDNNYTYAWSSSAGTNQTENNLSAGTYVVTVTDGNGCTGTETFAVGQPATPITFTFGPVVNNQCFGGTNGSIITSVAGGVIPYTFSWSDGPTNRNRNNLAAGKYIVTVTDNNSCTAVDSVTITEQTEILVNFTQTNVLCNGAATGAATANITGGTPGYNFTWSEGTNGAGSSTTISNLSAGEYYITVTDAFACQKIDTVTITEASGIVISRDAINNPLCTGEANGSINLTVSGGTPNLTFAWNNLATTEDISGLVAGNYILTVTDANNCVEIFDTTLIDPLALNIVFDSLRNISCNGQNDGFLRVAPIGGTGAYTFSWSNLATTSSIDNLSQGTYRITVTDANGCTDLDSATIIEPAPISVSINSTDASCNGVNDGTATAVPVGGTLPYTYAWSTVPVQTTQGITNLTAGSYTVTLTDASGCTSTASKVIAQPNALSVSITKSDLNCNGDNSGVALANVLGGTAPYTFAWDDPLAQTTNPASGLAAGPYNVTVTDNKGCTATSSTNLIEPAVLTANINTSTNPTCNGVNDGTATVTPGGGTAPYTFAWSTTPVQTTATANNLGSGTFIVTVSDSKGCTETDQIILNAPTAITIVLDSISQVSCNGGNDGYIELAPTGGTLPYTYAWNVGANSPINANLVQGTYDVTVSDNNGCFNTASFPISEPSALTLSLTPTDVVCSGDNNGTITTVVGGGTPVYTFSWSDLSTDQDRINLTAGKYIVTVTDDNGCTIIDSATIAAPNAINIPAVVTDPTCINGNDGSINISPTGGTGAYTYLWSNPLPAQEDQTNLSAGKYTVTVSDANACTDTASFTLNNPAAISIAAVVNDISCNGFGDGSINLTISNGTAPYTFLWNDLNTNEDRFGLAQGTYDVTVSDNNGCSIDSTFTINEPALLTVSVTVTNQQCFGSSDGSITANPVGGTGAYTYLWLPGSQTTQTISNLNPGFYSVQVFDANGCLASGNGTVTPALPANLTVGSTPVSCNGGSDGAAAALALGGAGGFNYTWSDIGLAPQIRNGLTAGKYIVTATDANGCTLVDSTTVTETDTLKPFLTTYDISCGSTNDGAAAVNPTGGTAPYTFLWGPGNPSGQNTDSIFNLTVGNYFLTLSDNNGCDTIIPFIINQLPSSFTLDDSTFATSCNGGSDGEIKIFAIGGTAPFTYTWSPAQPNQANINNLTAGSYDVTVTDNSGCTQTRTMVVGEPTPVTVNFTTTDESCSPGSDGTISVTASGGNGPYNYTWNPVLPNDPNPTGLTAGTYKVTVTDVNNCSDSATMVINQIGGAFTLAITPQDISCNGAADGQITVVPNPAGNYTFNWDGGLANIFNPTVAAPGTYRVTVTDVVGGCSIIDSATINEPGLILANLSVTSTGCSGTGTGNAKSIPTGGNGAPFTFNWGPGNPQGQGTDSIFNLAAGNYFVTVTDVNLCFSIEAFTVGTATSNISPNEVVTAASCFGVCDGAISLTPSNGVAPYFYNWSDGTVTTANRTALCAGPYTVTITGSDNCDTVLTLNVGEPAAISAIINTTPDTCVSQAGGARVTAFANGTAPYTVNWPASGTPFGADSVNSLLAGNYNVTITDATACQIILPFTITNESDFSLNLDSTDVSCNGGNNGSIIVNVIGGTAPVTYDWNGVGLSGANPTGLSAGTYTITVTDANGCGAIKDIVVNEPALLEVDSIIVYNESCAPGNDGAARALVIGGTAPYSYTWPAVGIAVNDSVNSLVAGTYNMTVTDNNGCAATRFFTIGSTAAFTVNITSTDASCGGGTDGTISVSLIGATAPLTFNWSDIGVGSANRTNLAAGNYLLTVTDASTCSETSSTTIGQANAVQIDNVTTTDESCNPGSDGTATAVVSGGTTPYTYSWSGTTATTPGITGLAAGVYNLTVTDANGCSDNGGFLIEAGSNIDANETVTDILCFGGNDGAISLSPSGGIAPYTYNWSPISSTSPSITNLGAGGYQVTITDNTGCSKIDSYVVRQPQDLVCSFTTTVETCSPGNDGTVRANAARGTGPYTYDFGSGNTSVSTLNNLAAGSYQMTVTDANGCTKAFAYSIAPAPAITVSTTKTPATCGNSDGSITVTVAGGTNPLTYDWSDVTVGGADPKNLAAGTYTITVTDGNGCTDSETIVITTNGSFPINETIVTPTCNGDCDGSITLSPSGGTTPYTYLWDDNSTDFFRLSLCDGSYDVTVTDNTGCSTSQTIVVVEPAPILVNISGTDESCNPGNDGSATTAAAGGTAPYTYLWDDNSTNSSRTGLSSGRYKVTVSDNNGCFIIDSVDINSGGNLALNEVIVDASCDGDCDGSITLSPSGGNSPYTFLWDDNSTNSSRNNLCEGNYGVTVTDNSGCSTTTSLAVTDPDPLLANITKVDATCFPGLDGSINPNPTGGTAPYTYLWAPGGATTPNLTGLNPGSFTLTLTDSKGCSVVENITVINGSNLSQNPTVVDASCFGVCDGSITLSPSGGFDPNYSFLWDDNSTFFFRAGLCAGSYSVTVSNRFGCSVARSYVIDEPDSLQARISSLDESCIPGGDGTASTSAIGGTAPYTYIWDPGAATTSGLSSLISGTYSVTISDSKGCTVVDSTTVRSGGNLLLNEVIVDANCNGNCDGSISLIPSGGNTPYTYLWDDNSTNSSRTGLCAGSYGVTVSDNTGCVTTTTLDVREPAELLANTSATAESCSPGGDGAASTAASGGTAPYTYLWSPGGATTLGLSSLSAGTYKVTITDSKGCTVVDSSIVNSGGNIVINGTKTDASCDGVCDGSITLAPSGGNAPYTFLWNDNTTNSNRNGLCAGTYDVTVSDNTGCSTTTSFTIDDPAPILANTGAIDESCTPGGDGRATTAATGGTAPYTYLWSPGGAITPNLSSLSAGTYRVTITDINGCTVLDSSVVNSGVNIALNAATIGARCNGDCDGSITLSPSGGNTPYTYLWDDNSTDFFRTGLCAGNYDVTVTDNTGCVRISTIPVGEPNPLLANGSFTDESCQPGGDGATATAASGGTAPYTYLWSVGSATTPGLSGLTAGAYTVTVTDFNGCTVAETINVGSNAPFTLTEIVTDESCGGAADGSIDLTVVGAVGVLTYDWSDIGIAGPLRTNLAPAIYGVTITDGGNGCIDTESYTINSGGTITLTTVVVDASCSPGNDGSINLTVSGGSTPYTYAWSDLNTNQNRTGLSANVYTVTVTDNNGCTASTFANVGGSAPFTVSVSSTDISCNGLSDGSANISLSGETPPVTFVWSGGLSGQNPSGIPLGSYTVTISDASGCSEVRNVIIDEPDVITANTGSISTTACNICNGKAYVENITGGTAPINISWLDFSKTPISQTADTARNLCPGIYFVALQDANGCVDTLSTTVSDGPAFPITTSSTDESCFNACNGTATVSSPCISSLDCTVEWKDLSNNVIGTTPAISNLCPGDYIAEVTDINSGCVVFETITILPASQIIPNLTSRDDGCSAIALCQGYAVAKPSGGATPYTFDWAGPSTTVSGVDSIGSLCAGNYTLTITDANGCDTIIPFTIAPKPIIVTNQSFTNESCSGICDGTASVDPLGGQTPYTYAWSNSAGNVKAISGLCSGTYTVTITDAVSCDTTVTFNIGSSGLTYTLNSTDQSCNLGCDGTAEVQIPGGTAGYQFNWSPAPGAGQGTDQVSGLCVGKYFVTITLTASGCTAIDSVTIDPSTPILPNESFSNESCAAACDGVARVSPSGGVGSYTYLWTPTPPNGQQGNAEIRNLCAGNYTVQISDAAGCDTSITFTIAPASAIVSNIIGEDQLCGNSVPCEGKAFVSPTGGVAPYTYQWTLGVTTGVSPDTAINLCDGKYFVTITDANACTLLDSITINGPAPIDTAFTVVNSTCNICDGSITVSPTGGTAPYTYNWLDASLNPLGVTIDNVSNLCSGIYFVDISDNVGCTARFARSVSDNGSENVSLTKTDVTCFNGNDGTATASFICADTPCSIEWLDGTAQPIGVTTATASNLSAGTYFVEVTNGSGCKAFENITINQPTQILVGPTVTDVSCNSSCDGAISLNVAGGSSPYTFNWSPSPGSGQGTSTVTGLCAVDYNVTVSDANGCDTVLTINVGSPSLMTATFNNLPSNCNQSDGFINATVSGGTVTFDYQYQWLDGANNLLTGQVAPSLANVAAGTYVLRVRDDNNCEQRFTTVLGSSNSPTIVIDSITNLSCFGDNSGEIFITASGANTPFTYSWLNQGQTSEDIQNLVAGTYTVQVTNSVGCVATETASITGPDNLLASFNTQDATCGQCNGEATISVSGGTAPYTYLWSSGSTADTTGGLCGGAHSVLVTDASGCTKNFNYSINTVGGPTNATVAATAESCAGAADGSATVTPVGGTTPYTYLWIHNGATTNSLSNLTAGSYFLLITDAAGCSRNVEVVITAPTELIIQESVVPSSCGAASCDGSIALNVTGGNGPYTFDWINSPGADTNFLGGLCAGIYNVTVTDANGCTKVSGIILPNSGNPVVANPTTNNVSCQGSCDGSLLSNLTPSANVSFRWLNGQGQAIAPIDSDLLNAACAGDYILEVTSTADNCKSFARVTVTEPDSIILGASIVKNISCNGECDGEIFISTIGGNILYSYSWNDPNNQDGIPATDLCAGVYSVTATDANGCSATTSVTLVDPAELVLTLNSSTFLNCSSDCDAQADVSASGGTAPYSFDWSGGQSGNNPNNLCFGPNIITVIDATGCSRNLTVNIGAIDTVVAAVPAINLICEGDSLFLDGTISGSTVTSFGWYLEDTTTLFTSSIDTTILRGVGNYTFFLIATNGSCEDTTQYDVEVVESPNLSVPAAVNIYKNEVATIRVSGQDQSYLYNWSPPTDLNNSSVAEPVSSTRESRTYLLTVTDTNGCNYIDSVRVIYNPNLGIPSGLSPNGDGKNDVWNIDVLEEFPNAKVQIYNRWGELIYEQANGYNKPWDGTFNGKALPIGTYYYVIDLKSDRFDPVTGPITIVK